ncbi:hypothetical protein Bca52824_013755 [Brassica carinata]|uniref:F-box/LRR-repeat protein 15/At3g58940/PEG3-like LRR domain-containing protein n=1 Tax=Brassica carinata TaxID=52824 RepID=A0A8X8B3R7_BRACI|nr:hypothetical protein Bca52824_013755 [Brassica carinata]
MLERGVPDFELNLWDVEYPLPSKLFVSESLVKLTLLRGDSLSVTFNLDDVSLPNLKTLSLDYLFFEGSDVGLAKLLSGCPVLEELALLNIGNPESVSSDTPNLVYLAYVDTIANKYPEVSFNSLVEAYAGLRLTKDQRAYASFQDDYFIEGAEEKQMLGRETPPSFLWEYAMFEHFLYLLNHLRYLDSAVKQRWYSTT